ncbi:unnamed protein product [Phytophthora lilii]|uniref:Hexosyltransferase n=1 Tax=Phytophthora lilii TaxID=2077276 RepID=A0A9W6X1V5_9STRA|nr:unnamed protein product [Phytophthora lilii]
MQSIAWRLTVGPGESANHFWDMIFGARSSQTAITLPSCIDNKYHETSPVTFTVVKHNTFDLYFGDKVRHYWDVRHFPDDENILEWAERHFQSTSKTNSRAGNYEALSSLYPSSHASSSDSSDLTTIVGIKTAVLTNFHKRQSIRDTWAKGTVVPSGVKVFFLGCTPNITAIDDVLDRRYFEHAVKLERQMYGDLLTEELDCEDWYQLLADKVKTFFHFAAAEIPSARFVILADDDIYLRLDHLSRFLQNQDSRQYYFGEIWRVLLNQKEHPICDPSLSNYLSTDQYPLEEYPPYPVGACYAVSMAFARFIGQNHWCLRSLNGIEDASTALWLFATQTHPQLAQTFTTLRIGTTLSVWLNFLLLVFDLYTKIFSVVAISATVLIRDVIRTPLRKVKSSYDYKTIKEENVLYMSEHM